MGMKNTRAAQQASDANLRAAIEAGDYDSIQIQLGTGLDINKARNQVCRVGLGKAGNGQG